MKKIKHFLLIILFISLCSHNSVLEKSKITYVVYKVVASNAQNNSTIGAKKKFDEDKLEFELFFDNNNSLFRLMDKMVDDNDKYYKMTSILYGGGYVYFKDIKEKLKFHNVNLIRKKYNVVVPFEQYKWEILNEVKIIQGFKCYKATTTIEVEDKGKNTKKILHPVVWFTSVIPSSFGPKGLDGLPGLVLEGSLDGRVNFYATKIVQDYKGLRKIEKPLADETITVERFNDLNAELYKTNKAKADSLQIELKKK